MSKPAHDFRINSVVGRCAIGKDDFKEGSEKSSVGTSPRNAAAKPALGSSDVLFGKTALRSSRDLR